MRGPAIIARAAGRRMPWRRRAGCARRCPRPAGAAQLPTFAERARPHARLRRCRSLDRHGAPLHELRVDPTRAPPGLGAAGRRSRRRCAHAVVARRGPALRRARRRRLARACGGRAAAACGLGARAAPARITMQLAAHARRRRWRARGARRSVAQKLRPDAAALRAGAALAQGRRSSRPTSTSSPFRGELRGIGAPRAALFGKAPQRARRARRRRSLAALMRAPERRRRARVRARACGVLPGMQLGGGAGVAHALTAQALAAPPARHAGRAMALAPHVARRLLRAAAAAARAQHARRAACSASRCERAAPPARRAARPQRRATAPCSCVDNASGEVLA
ncbi:MAG: hypothetical protein MZV65_37475 [Chromatiales bacterium]|nr:hypothetical protein [Chromatiales bacterium]